MKKLIMTIAIATMLAVPAMAQVFLDDEAMNANRDPQTGGPGAFIPEQNVGVGRKRERGGFSLSLEIRRSV